MCLLELDSRLGGAAQQRGRPLPALQGTPAVISHIEPTVGTRCYGNPQEGCWEEVLGTTLQTEDEDSEEQV